VSNNEKIDLEEIRAIIDWLNVSDDIKAFSLKYGELEITMSRREHGDPALIHTPASAVSQAPTESQAPEAESTKSAEEPSAVAVNAEEGLELIKAPMVGTFYASPKPDAPPFVEVGQEVQPDTTLCIIEVMKLMHTVEAKVSGVIKEIYVTDNQAVEYGQPLMAIETR